jgi:hypothetical protein
LRRNFVWTPGAAIFRRSSPAAIGGFCEDIGPAADYAVYLTFARAGTVSFDAREVVRYRQSDAAMSRDPVLMLDAVLRVLRRERPHVPPECFAAFKAGGREWRSFYGEQRKVKRFPSIGEVSINGNVSGSRAGRAPERKVTGPGRLQPVAGALVFVFSVWQGRCMS